ncbi:MAG: hypothetical protein RLZZ455_576 [Candidatus Parcubacteria bacterium]|jgi:putative membrane protein insertion efficiency factor
MKSIFVSIIRFYQTFISFPLRVLTGSVTSCKYTPTCSEYAVIVLREYGAVKGGAKAFWRILTCQPFIR